MNFFAVISFFILSEAEHIMQEIIYHMQCHRYKDISAFQKCNAEYDAENDDLNESEMKKNPSQFAVNRPGGNMDCHEHQ